MEKGASGKQFEMKEIEMLLACEYGDCDTSMEYEEDENESRWSLMNQAIEKDVPRFDLNAKEQNIKEAVEKERLKAESDEKKAKEARAEEVRQAELKARKRIRDIPPGLRVFSGKPFGYFTAKSLDLDTDFQYFRRKRAYLKSKLSMSDEDITKIFSNPNEFVLHLSTDSRSILISDEDDFVGVCEYLFYAQVATANKDTMAIFEKALLDLLRNYDYIRWQLKLKHFLVALLNLGANPEMIMDENHYKSAFAQRISLVTEMYRNNQKTFRFIVTKMPDFFTKRHQLGPKDPDPADLEIREKRWEKPKTSGTGADVVRSPEEVADEARYRSVHQLLKLFNAILSNFEAHTVTLLAPTSDSNVDWLNSVIFLHILATLSSDHKLIRESKRSLLEITEIYALILSSFSTFQWSGSGSSPHLMDQEDPDDDVTACCDIVESFFYTGHIFGQVDDENYHKYNRRISEHRCWTKDDVPTFRLFQHLDHFHNMVHRIDLLPTTWRGNEIKKAVAFMNLQQIVDHRGKVASYPHTNMADLWAWLETKRPKLKLYFTELYLILNILRLIDIVAGSEPLLDFAPEKVVTAVKQTAEFLTECGNQFLRSNQNFYEDDMTRVQEYINQLDSKWKLMMDSARDARYETQMPITKFAQPIRGSKSNSNTEASDQDQEVDEHDLFEQSPDSSNSGEKSPETSNSEGQSSESVNQNE